MFNKKLKGVPVVKKEDNVSSPVVSIIMGIYNCEKTLEESIESIINQTFTDWEFILCDDGSSDNTLKIAKVYENKDNRIKVIKNDTNRGLTYSLNKCLNFSKGKYIARQDGDDISKPERLSKQIEFLLNNQLNINFVSTSISFFNEESFWGKTKPIEFPQKEHFIHHSPFAHAAVMIEKQALDCVDGYKDVFWTKRVEDYNLWFRLYAAGFRGANLSESLYEVRDDIDAFKRRKFRFRLNESIVRWNGYKMLKISKYQYVHVFRPILTAMLPHKFYIKIRSKLYN